MALFSEEHLRLIKSLLNHHVKFVIIGGHAAIYYGVTRNTGDLDILIEPSIENGKRLMAALKNLELELPEIAENEFTQNLVLTFGLEPDAVDILNYTPGLEFNQVYKSAVESDFSDLRIKIIDLRSLIKNKESLNRTGEKSYLDKYDVEALKKILLSREK
jgi:hypothetical protein